MTEQRPSDPVAKQRAIAFMFASAACWGLSTVLSKRALQELPPMSLLAAQLGASLVFLWTLVRLYGHRITLDRGARLAALSGILEPGLAYALGIFGLSLTRASNASLISATEPLWVVLLALVLFGVRTTRRQLVAIVIAMVGVVLTSVTDLAVDAGYVGDAFIVVATLFAALYVVITSRLVATSAPLPTAALQQTVGFAFALALMGGALAFGLEHIAAWPSPAGWALIVASGVVQYGLAFWFYLNALRALPVGTAAVFLALIPVFGVGGAVLLLDESLSPDQVIGSILILAAVVAAARQPVVHVSPPRPAHRSTRRAGSAHATPKRSDHFSRRSTMS